MGQLIRLEWKKNHISTYLRSALVLALLLVIFIFSLAFLGIANDPGTGYLDAAPGSNAISSPIELFTSMAYLIFTGAMLSSFVVAPYQNKTMNLMFSYPIPRKKILLSQMLAPWIFCFVCLVLTKLLLYGGIMVGSLFLPPTFPIDFNMVLPSFYMQLLVKSGILVSLGFMALFVGLRLRSTKATIITSFLLILLTQANVGDITLAKNGSAALVLAGISLACMVLCLHRVETKDVL